MTSPNDRPDLPIRRVRAGMRVLDVDGETIGTVVHVSTGDKPPPGDGGLDGGRAVRMMSSGASHAGGEAVDRLLPDGYLKVVDAGAQRVGRYVGADQISEVHQATVLLRVGRDLLIAQH